MQDGSTQIVDLIRGGQIQLVLNTPLGPHAHKDGVEIRIPLRGTRGSDRDERAAAHDPFRGNGGCLCDSGAGKEGVAVSKFTESFWGRLIGVSHR